MPSPEPVIVKRKASPMPICPLLAKETAINNKHIINVPVISAYEKLFCHIWKQVINTRPAIITGMYISLYLKSVIVHISKTAPNIIYSKILLSIIAPPVFILFFYFPHLLHAGSPPVSSFLTRLIFLLIFGQSLYLWYLSP